MASEQSAQIESLLERKRRLGGRPGRRNRHPSSSEVDRGSGVVLDKEDGTQPHSNFVSNLSSSLDRVIRLQGRSRSPRWWVARAWTVPTAEQWSPPRKGVPILAAGKVRPSGTSTAPLRRLYKVETSVYGDTGLQYPRPMAECVVWVQGQIQETGAGTVRTWHLAKAPEETLCGTTTQGMKAAPQAAWEQVLNPCTECQRKADLADAHRGLAS